MRDADKNQYMAVLNDVLLFKFLDKAEKDALFEKAEILNVADNEIIIHEGEFSPYLYVVLDGCASVQVKRGEKDVYISTIGAGDVVGEAGLFINVKRTANVISCGDSVILSLKRDAFLSFIAANPRGGSRILMVIIYGLLKKLREANQELSFERKSDIDQSDIDEMVSNVMLDSELQ